MPEYNEKVAAWEAFYAEAQEEQESVRVAGMADIAKVTQDKTRLIAAPAAQSVKVSMHMVGGSKPQTREWKNPTASELSTVIPPIITRALKAAAEANQIALEQIPEPGSRNRFWRKKFDATAAKVSYGMMMLTNAKNGQAVPLPPSAQGTPVQLPVASINENTSADPNHKSEL